MVQPCLPTNHLHLIMSKEVCSYEPNGKIVLLFTGDAKRGCQAVRRMAHNFFGGEFSNSLNFILKRNNKMSVSM